MTEKKNAITEVQAMTTLVEFAKENGFENAEVLDKAAHMIEVRSKKRERKTDDSKRLANIALGEQFAEIWGEREDKTFKASDVAAALGLGSVAKASAVCKAMNWEKVPTTEKVAVYSL